MPKLRRAVLACLFLAGSLSLAGCGAGTVALEPAADSNAPECADITVRLPELLGGSGPSGTQDRRWTNAQATGAWGDPTSVILRCGVEVPGPTTLQCVTFGAVDWIVDPSDLPWQRITTYGRDPAVQISIDTSVLSPDGVLDRMSSIVDILPENGHSCVSLDDAEPVDG